MRRLNLISAFGLIMFAVCSTSHPTTKVATSLKTAPSPTNVPVIASSPSTELSTPLQPVLAMVSTTTAPRPPFNVEEDIYRDRVHFWWRMLNTGFGQARKDNTLTPIFNAIDRICQEQQNQKSVSSRFRPSFKLWKTALKEIAGWVTTN